jgi:hypothetical protein
MIRARAGASRTGLIPLLLATVSLLVPLSSAEADTARPHWTIISTAWPTYFNAGDESDFYEVIAVNDGAAPTDGSTITVAETLPPQLTATVSGGAAGIEPHDFVSSPLICSSPVSCETEAGTIVPPGAVVRLKVMVTVAKGASGVMEGAATISGGGAAAASAASATLISPGPVPFGASITSRLTARDGTPDTQAGSHDFAITTMLALNVSGVDTASECHESPGCPLLNADARDINLEWPTGLIGNPQAVPKCPQSAFQATGNHNCPPDTQVGYAQLFFYGSGTATQYAPVYNLRAPPDLPGELGFTAAGINHIPIFLNVRSGGDYGLTASLAGISEADPVHVAALTLWGVPASSSHDGDRQGPESSGCEAGCPSGVVATPFLRLPTHCPGGLLELPLSTDSWQEPGPGPKKVLGTFPGTTGCEHVPFAPSLTIRTDNHVAGAPAGYSSQLSIPQSEDPESLASSDLRDAVVNLPAGTTVSPSATNGLQACPLAQFALNEGKPGNCPGPSTIGTATMDTPVLETPLVGHIFLGEPECSPCSESDAQSGRMLPLLIEAKGAGVIIKLLSHAHVDPATGSVTLEFSDSPQLPLTDIELALQPGQDALLANPTICGPALATAQLTPWTGSAAVEVSSPVVAIGGCSPAGFAPSVTAGMTLTPRAGSFSSFAVTINRHDGDQELGTFVVRTPPGLLGRLASVPTCAEAQANAGTCSSASQIGSSSAVIGPGLQPLELAGGTVFLTGPYAGQPFGLSIVLPTQAGPLTLGGTTGAGTIVVRASIAVDSRTSALTISSAMLPRAIDGIPLDLTRLILNLNRAAFTFNPTSCRPMSIDTTVTSVSGASARAAHPFQSLDCGKLTFAPRLTALTQAKTSIARGASLHVKLRFGAADANVSKLKIALPSQLPTRLTTLQKACRAAVFDANPASCPRGSVVGTGFAQTVVLKGTMAGPAYLVSHGGAAFPDLEVVLQGEGVTLLLDGHTNISNGISSANFSELPDTPVKVFDLVLPQGPGALLGANLPRRARRSMCRQKLTAPVQITSQSGVVLTQQIKIAVAGCHAKKIAHRAAGVKRRPRARARHA